MPEHNADLWVATKTAIDGFLSALQDGSLDTIPAPKEPSGEVLLRGGPDGAYNPTAVRFWMTRRRLLRTWPRACAACGESFRPQFFGGKVQPVLCPTCREEK